MIVITQNVTTNLSIPLTDYFSKEQLQNIIAIELTLGEKTQQVRKLWYNYDRSRSTMTFIQHTNTLNLKINAAESAQWLYQIPAQIRIKDRTGNISANSNIFYAFVQPTLSAEEF